MILFDPWESSKVLPGVMSDAKLDFILDPRTQHMDSIEQIP